MAKIVAVDDDPVFRAFIEKTFAGSDHQLATVGEPERAHAVVREQRPDLVILDFEMPNLSGIQVFERLQTDATIRDIPVWMCSSQGDEALMAEAYQLGITDYVVKPISAVAFRAKVDRFFRKNTHHDARTRLLATEEGLAKADDHIRKLLPKIPALEQIDIGLVYKPHDRVGGDFYDFFQTGRGTTALMIGDVTGHGVEAAVIQTMARKLIQMTCRFGESLEHGLLAANAELKNDLPKGNFVGAVIAEWFPEARTLRFYRLGLPHPLLRQHNVTVRVVMSGGTILGMHPDDRFAKFIAPTDVQLNPGDALLLHTDGAIEAPLPTGTDLGFEGLRAILRETGEESASAQELADVWYKELRARAGVDDDITFLVIKAR